MPTYQLAVFHGGACASPVPRRMRIQMPGRGLLAGLARAAKRRRERVVLDHFNDHMLADIGLRPGTRAPTGVRRPDPWSFVQRLG